MSAPTRVFTFRAIDGSQFLGFLAGLGLCRALAAKWPAVKLSWNPDGSYPMPCLQTPVATTREEITDALLTIRERWMTFGGGLPDEFSRFSFDAGAYRAFALASLSQAAENTCWESFAGTETAVLSRKGERRFVRTHYYFISGQQTFTGIARGLSQAISKEGLDLLFDKSPGEIPLEDCECLRFEPAEVEDHALRFINPSKDTGAANVPLNFLAFAALSLLSTLPSPKFVKCLCSSPEAKRDEIDLRWRLWPDFVGIETAVSIQRLAADGSGPGSRTYSARAVKAVRGQNYMRMLPAVRLR
jgi:hypothetical protein